MVSEMVAEPEDDYTSLDGDSAFGESISDQSDTTSLASSIKQYRIENGRTYHTYGSNEYWGPSDELEQDKMDISHHWYTLLSDGKLLRTPVKPGLHRALDLGTGTGIWCMDFADMYPEAEGQVKGVDISPIQPPYVPPNCRFEVDDYNGEFYDENKFDLIHQRELLGSIVDPPKFYAECYKALAPEGWVDITEIDPIDTFSAANDDKGITELTPLEHPLHGNGAMFIKACKQAGIEGRIAPKIEGWLKDAGFKNITARVEKVPIGSWPKDTKQKEIGAWNLLRLQSAMVGIYMRLGTTQMGLTPAEVHVYCARIRNALKETHWQLYLNVYFISAQKPKATDPMNA